MFKYYLFINLNNRNHKCRFDKKIILVFYYYDLLFIPIMLCLPLFFSEVKSISSA